MIFTPETVQWWEVLSAIVSMLGLFANGTTFMYKVGNALAVHTIYRNLVDRELRGESINDVEWDDYSMRSVVVSKDLRHHAFFCIIQVFLVSLAFSLLATPLTTNPGPSVTASRVISTAAYIFISGGLTALGIWDIRSRATLLAIYERQKARLTWDGKKERRRPNQPPFGEIQ